MARHEKKQAWYTCDICNEKCDPVGEFEIMLGFNPQGGDVSKAVILSPKAYVHYVTANGDVCESCLFDAIRKAVNGSALVSVRKKTY